MVNNISWRLLNPANSANPEDDLGLWHNLLLEYIIASKFKLPEDPSNRIKTIVALFDIALPKAIELTSSTPTIKEIDEAFIVVMGIA